MYKLWLWKDQLGIQKKVKQVTSQKPVLRRRCGTFDSLGQRAVGLVPQFSVAPPVGHVCSERVPPLLPQNLFYQLGAGHVHHNQRAVRRFPQMPVDLAVLNLWQNNCSYYLRGLNVPNRLQNWELTLITFNLFGQKLKAEPLGLQEGFYFHLWWLDVISSETLQVDLF